MKRTSLSCYVLITAAALLAGCGGSQPPIGAPGAMPQSRAVATHGGHGTSSMTGGTSGQALLYVSFYRGRVYILTYPDGKRVRRFDPLEFVSGLCADSSGHVFVDGDKGGEGYIVEYTRGSTIPTRTLVTGANYPASCAADATTGNLALSSVTSRPAPIALAYIGMREATQRTIWSRVYTRSWAARTTITATCSSVGVAATLRTNWPS